LRHHGGPVGFLPGLVSHGYLLIDTWNSLFSRRWTMFLFRFPADVLSRKLTFKKNGFHVEVKYVNPWVGYVQGRCHVSAHQAWWIWTCLDTFGHFSY
jgi:hypothetical protein